MLEKTIEVSNVNLEVYEGDLWNFCWSVRRREYLQGLLFDCPFWQVKTVEVSNVSLGASEQDIREFFQGIGKIEYIEMQSDNELTQITYVTFTDSQGAIVAAYRSGETVIDLVVTVRLKLNYMLPPAASEPFERVDHNALPTDETAPGSGDAGGEAGDVILKARKISEKTKGKLEEKEREGKAVDCYAHVLSESTKASAPSEPGASRPAKRRKLKRPICWEKESKEMQAVCGPPIASARSELGAPSTLAKRRRRWGDVGINQ